MYLTAHHVVSPTTQSEGVNAFLYLHGSMLWDGPPPSGVPDEDPGTLVAQSLSVEPPGNRVRSYLDIVAPDAAHWEEIRQGLMDFVGCSQSAQLPWQGHSGRCLFRLGMDLGLSPNWQRELAILYRAAQALRLANPQ
jgi:hypothetical protein